MKGFDNMEVKIDDSTARAEQCQHIDVYRYIKNSYNEYITLGGATDGQFYSDRQDIL